MCLHVIVFVILIARNNARVAGSDIFLDYVVLYSVPGVNISQEKQVVFELS